MFIDQVILELFAGNGGNGLVAWRREKYLPKGGPYGGNGGIGGSILLSADNQLFSLDHYRNRYSIKAENGAQGGVNNRNGKNGEDLTLKVPCGTLVKDADSGEILYDLTQHEERVVICRGGNGGKGNVHFKSSKNRAPNFATNGTEGGHLRVQLELKLIADVGLVGFPNAGKSTFLSKVTGANAKIADYPFTTLHPNLGYVLHEDSGRILIADIPGIIDGAHKNKGLGLEFLKHIERTHILLFLLDVSGCEGRDPVKDFEALRYEMSQYNPSLLNKDFLVALNKVDKGFVGEEFYSLYPEVSAFEISASTGDGINKLLDCLKRKLIV